VKFEYSFFIFLNINSRYEELRNDSDAQSIRGSINSNDIKQLQLIIPSENILIHFSKVVNPFYRIIKNKFEQNQKLTELKDLLHTKMTKIEELIKI
jgi:type I restriction enzyme, S subunit